MANLCCCTSTLKYCDQNICGDGVDFNVQAQIPGVFQMVASFLNTQILIEQEFAQDEEIIFPIDKLNENYEYTVELFDPNGDRIIIQKDDINYDCFKFRTVIQMPLNIVEIES